MGKIEVGDAFLFLSGILLYHHKYLSVSIRDSEQLSKVYLFIKKKTFLKRLYIGA